MKATILGSGGCMVIPKPLCRCRVCHEARKKGVPYARTGPSLFIHDENLLIDTPADIIPQLNRVEIGRIDHLLFTHLDPDHTEGFRVVEQIALDFRSWEAYPHKQVALRLPSPLMEALNKVRSVYGSLADFYRRQGFIRCIPMEERTKIGGLTVTALPILRGEQTAYVYVFEKRGKKLVYAPCDIKPFPEGRSEVFGADLLLIQPGLFEDGLKHGFTYPSDHVSRRTLYTFRETLDLAARIRAKQVLMVHLEEYWNRSHDDYQRMAEGLRNVQFAYDGMTWII